MLLLLACSSIVILLVLIAWLKINPVVSMLVTSVFLGLASGMPSDMLVHSIQSGMGYTLGMIAIVLGLGAMLGKMMEESGGAERIARTFIEAFGIRRIDWAMMCVALIVGIPVFFQVGFVLLIPIVFTIARDTGMSLLKIGLPLVAGLNVMHGLVPPHPAVMATVSICHADAGKTILYGFAIGLPLAIISGPLFARFISGRMPHIPVPDKYKGQIVPEQPINNLPGFGITLLTVLMPVLLMVIGTLAVTLLPPDSQWLAVLRFIGNPNIALLVALLFSFVSLGVSRNFSLERIGQSCDSSLRSMAAILMIIGAGGSFSKVLINSGVASEISALANGMQLDPIILVWCVTAAIRTVIGSPTVAMMAAAGIVEPMIGKTGMPAPEIIVMALGSGALVFSHVNCAGFWIVKEYFGMTTTATLKTWTVLVTITGVCGLLLTILLAQLTR